jgi:hypothetical protein
VPQPGWGASSASYAHSARERVLCDERLGCAASSCRLEANSASFAFMKLRMRSDHSTMRSDPSRSGGVCSRAAAGRDNFIQSC